MTECSFVFAATQASVFGNFRVISSSGWDYLATCSQARVECERFKISIGSWIEEFRVLIRALSKVRLRGLIKINIFTQSRATISSFLPRRRALFARALGSSPAWSVRFSPFRPAFSAFAALRGLAGFNMTDGPGSTKSACAYV